jgi:hypothetical protein
MSTTEVFGHRVFALTESIDKQVALTDEITALAKEAQQLATKIQDETEELITLLDDKPL